MKELETNEDKKVLNLWKRVVIIIVATIAIIPTMILILIFSSETTPLILLLLPLAILFIWILSWVINPYGECCYPATKLVVKKDRFILYLESGDICYFPFSRIIKVNV